jgi:hypothetical protein
VRRQRWADPRLERRASNFALLYAILLGGSALDLFAVLYWAATSAMSDQFGPQGRDHGSHAAAVRSTSGDGFDSRDFRNALDTFGTGVTIITARSASGGSAG